MGDFSELRLNQEENMRLYLAMWVRGPAGTNVTTEEMQNNKNKAKYVANKIAHATERLHTLVIPHTDPALSKIDTIWLKNKDVFWCNKAMERCFALLSSCDGIILITRGFMSEGMKQEKAYAEERGMFVYEAEELTDETLEDLCLSLLDYEVHGSPKLK